MFPRPPCWISGLLSTAVLHVHKYLSLSFFLAGVSVAVSVLTLVSISLERYFAICQPLRSRSWQTLSHAYKMIGVVWLLSFLIMVPIAIFHQHIPLRNGRHVCREIWKNKVSFCFIVDICLSSASNPMDTTEGDKIYT